MKSIIECPYCDGNAYLTKQIGELKFRKEAFQVVKHFYTCDRCMEEFTTTEADQLTYNQLVNQYRAKYHIPSAEEIKAIREQYGISARKMSELLGMGVNNYGNYENGEIPTEAYANYIHLAANPTNFSEIVKDKVDINDPILSKIKEAKARKSAVNKLIQPINHINQANEFTGFRKTDWVKIENAIIILITESNPNYNDKLKLNKQLFYTDYYHFKTYGTSVTGLSYRAIPYGPVPTCYDNIFGNLINESILVADWKEGTNGSASELLKTDIKPDWSVFSDSEKIAIRTVIEKFKNIHTWDLVNLSHKEKAWIEFEKQRGVIDYQKYAFDLIAL
jgi:putative zinc finger/helix-turn-helix YgiT family protein